MKAPGGRDVLACFLKEARDGAFWRSDGSEFQTVEKLFMRGLKGARWFVDLNKGRKKGTVGLTRQSDSTTGLPVCTETETAQEASAAL